MAGMLLFFLAGLVILILGADLLVRCAARLAAAFGVSPLTIGLTIVAIGTASPEIAVSLQAAFKGQGNLTLGNVLGSNIFNILFILGTTALITPVVIAKQLIRKDAPIMLGVSLLTLLLALDGSLKRWDGALLHLGLIVYMVFALRQSRQESSDVQDEFTREFAPKESRTLRHTISNLIFVIAGLGLLVLGSNLLVTSAAEIASALGVSELIVGLTIVAIGTSLPEVATSVMAALRGESDIAVGNAVGSNIFNLLGVLGIGALVAPDGIAVADHILQLDLPIMLFAALVALPVFYIDSRISRFEGGLLLAYYAIYLTYLILRALNSSSVSVFGLFMAFFGLLTFLGLTVLAFRSVRIKPI